MIKYRFPEEKEMLLHYAKKFNAKNIEDILNKEKIESPEEAKALATFFWAMVDQSVIDSESNSTVAGCSNLESCCEDILQTLRSHFIATGYMQIWESISDNA